MKRKDLTPGMVVFVAENRDYHERDGRSNAYGKAKVIMPAVRVYRRPGAKLEFTAIEPGAYGYGTAPVLVEIEEGHSGKPVQVAMPLTQIIGHYESVAAEIKEYREKRDAHEKQRNEQHKAEVARATGLATELHALLGEAGGPLAFSRDAIEARGTRSRDGNKRIELSLDAAARIIELLDAHSHCPR